MTGELRTDVLISGDDWIIKVPCTAEYKVEETEKGRDIQITKVSLSLTGLDELVKNAVKRSEVLKDDVTSLLERYG